MSDEWMRALRAQERGSSCIGAVCRWCVGLFVHLLHTNPPRSSMFACTAHLSKCCDPLCALAPRAQVRALGRAYEEGRTTNGNKAGGAGAEKPFFELPSREVRLRVQALLSCVLASLLVSHAGL